MADLDDFFKKRDKKKKTTKSKFVTLDTEEFAKQLEATTVRTVEEEIEFQENGDFSTPVANIAVPGENLDEEWKPFDSEENKDYTGLRIKIENWKVEDEENNNEGIDVEQEKKAACPWGVCSSGPKDEKDTEEAKENQEKIEVAEVKAPEPEPAREQSKPEAYVPPYLRKQQSSASSNQPSGVYVPPSVRKTQKVQPNIMDTLEFPTLNAVVDTTEKIANGGEKFELPKKSGRVENKKAGGSSIEIENKFTALSSTNN